MAQQVLTITQAQRSVTQVAAVAAALSQVARLAQTQATAVQVHQHRVTQEQPIEAAAAVEALDYQMAAMVAAVK